MQLKGRREDDSWFVGHSDAVVIPLAELTAGRTYSILLERCLAPHKAIEKFSSMMIHVHWPSVWRSLTLWRFTRSVADTNYYNFHGRLATADRLIRFGFAFSDIICGFTAIDAGSTVSLPMPPRCCGWQSRLSDSR